MFVVGPPRSGVETLQWALRTHPELWGAEPSGFLADLLGDLRTAYRHGSAPDQSFLAGRDVAWEDFAAAVGTGVTRMMTGRAGGRRWVDHTDAYVHHLDGLAAMFPGAVFLVMRRDGRAAVAAMRRQAEPIPHEDACQRWAAAVTAAAAWEHGGGRAYRVAFEDLVTKPAPTLAGVFGHLGLDPSGEAVAFVTGRVPRSPAPPPAWADWTPVERQVFGDIAGDLLVQLGYEADHSWLDD